MAYQALYRKYRPTTFSEVVGQDHITETLKNELSLGKVFHAYLFTGTRGTGKTSCAKILAKAVNCINLKDGDPCGECEACKAIANGEVTDIAEIDAASNNGVDHIRSLREQINFVPADLKYRVYIIDEVHMLSESAFNALLKTLEEPPAHVIFVLATTEVHKLPATILSRCQRFDFKRIDNADISSRIMHIANSEGITVTNEAAALIAAAAEGGMRDALSLLDLCVSGSETIDEQAVIKACSLASREHLFSLADCIIESSSEKALVKLDEIYNMGADMLRLLNDLIKHFRNLMIVKTVKAELRPIVCSAEDMKRFEEQANSTSLTRIMAVLKQLNASVSLMQSGERRMQLELTLISVCENISNDYSSLLSRIEALENKASFTNSNANTSISVDLEPESTVKVQPAPKPEKQEVVTANDGRLENWNEVLKVLSTLCPPAVGVLNDSKAYISGDTLLIDAPNPMFRSMINANASMRESIKKAAAEVLGKNFRLGPYKKGAAVNNEDPLLSLDNKLKQFNIPGGN